MLLLICSYSTFIEYVDEMANKTVLVTGGAGYIGSHCIVTLHEAGYNVIALDNFTNSVNSSKDESLALKRVELITGKAVTFYKCDLLDMEGLDSIFKNASISYINVYFHIIRSFIF